MGSFNYTCAVSELSIGPGDDVLLIPLAHVKAGLNLGAQSQYSLAFPPIKGRYDDYGFVEGVQSTPFHEACANRFGGRSLGKFCEDLNEDSTQLTVAVRRRELPLEFCMVRQDAWDKLLALPIDSDRRSPGDGSMASLVEPAAREGVELFRAAREVLAQGEFAPLLASAMRADGEYDKDRLAMLLINGYILDKAASEGPFDSLLSFTLGGRGADALFLGMGNRALAVEMLESGASAEGFHEALRLCGECQCVNLAMFALRKVWSARDSSGPQSGEVALHWLWAKSLGELAEAQIDWSADHEGGWLLGMREAKALRERDAIAGAASDAPPSAKPRGI